MEVLRNTDKMVVLSACSRLMYTAECRARDLYRGMEHKYVRSSIDFLRERGVEVTWYIISANYGIVGESDVLHPYDFTFSDLRRYWVRSIAADRGIPYRYRKIIRDLDGAVLLHVIGESYMLALGYPMRVPKDSSMVYFGNKSISRLIPVQANVHLLQPSSAQARCCAKGHFMLQIVGSWNGSTEPSDEVA